MYALPWFRQLQHRWFPRRAVRPAPVRLRVRPWLEALEDRTVPAVFNVGPGDVATLIADINTANTNGDPTNTINLSAGTYNLMQINNFWYGPDGLPPIFSNLTINGNGATIQRGSGDNFRLIYVSGGQSGLPAGTLTLRNLTLQGGVAKGGDSGSGGGGLGAGGAIFNQGTLTLNGVTLTKDAAVGGSSGISGLAGGGGGMGQNAPSNGNGGGFGGTLTGGPFGGSGGSGGSGTSISFGGGGGSGYGGAIFNLDGNLSLAFCTLASNTVAGGTGSTTGNAAGGAVYNLAFGNTLTGGAQSATVILADSILANSSGGVDLVNNAINGKNTNTAW